MSRFSQNEVDRHNARVAASRTEQSNEKGNFKVGIGEASLHDDIKAECQRRRWYYVHSRMDRPTTTQKGVCDFIIAVNEGVTLWVELKAKGKKLTQEQFTAMHVLKALGHFHCVVYSFEDFLNYINSYAKI